MSLCPVRNDTRAAAAAFLCFFALQCVRNAASLLMRFPQTGQRRVWNKSELEALKLGVERLGRNWVGIIKAFPSVFGPTARTAGDLEKKWTRLAAKGDTKPSGEFTVSIAMGAGE
jgi:hypothetical protein